MVHLWPVLQAVHGFCTAYVWPIYGLCMTYIWYIYRLYMAIWGAGDLSPVIYWTDNDFSNLAITFDHDLRMTRNWYRSKALVEAHLFRGVSKNCIFWRIRPKYHRKSRPDAPLVIFHRCARHPPARPPADPSRASMKNWVQIWPYMAIYITMSYLNRGGSRILWSLS